MNDSKFYLCAPGSNTEKDCARFLDDYATAEYALGRVLERHGAVAFCGNRWRFAKGAPVSNAFTFLTKGDGDLPDTYLLNRRGKAGRAIAKEIEAAELMFPKRMEFHLKYSGFPLRAGRFHCTYPVRFRDRFYIVVPLNGWDGETRPPADSTEIKASEFYAAKEAAEQAESRRIEKSL